MAEQKRDKRSKFVELAESRVNRILSGLDSLSNLSNRRNYDYDQQQVRKIFKAISDKVKTTEQQFTESGSAKPFRLD
jgi:predicted signal transduction protein with EAL and GGDEF domain